MTLTGLYRMSPFEVATGWPTGREPCPRPDEALAALPPRITLERLVLPALQREPCMVGFSGGRDSSAVLAVATDVARRHGLADPVPVTRRYAGDRFAQEDEWQDLVVRHLGLTEWARLHFTDELDLLGDQATAALRRYGQIWPPMHYVKLPLLDEARGGSFLTGEGGDEMLESHRVAPITKLLSREVRVDRASVRRAAGALAPRWVRRWRARRRTHDDDAVPPWLRPEAAHAHRAALRADERGQPLRADATVRWFLGFRAVQASFRNIDALAAERDVHCVNPLLDPSFVASLGAALGWRGMPSRTATMRWLFGDLLPDEVCARRSKATFNTALFNARSREFVQRWDGSGVDEELVDPGVLREEWRSSFPHGGSFALLQGAWLATQGSGRRDHGFSGASAPAARGGSDG